MGLVQAERRAQPRYGGKKVYKAIAPKIREEGIRCGRDRLFDLLRGENMLVRKKKSYSRTTNSYHKFRKHKNLLKDLQVTMPEQAKDQLTDVRANYKVKLVTYMQVTGRYQ